MAKTKPSPDTSSRESPRFWARNIDASYKRRQKVLRDFEEFSRWHRGDLTRVVDPKAASEGYRWETGLENMTNLATVASMADLMFRYPRFIVRSPYSSAMPLFNPDLSKCETQYLTHTLQRVNYLVKARRALQDALLGGMGILKVTADNEVVVDPDMIELAKQEALQEMNDFLLSGVEMKAQEKQNHAVHIQVKGGYLAEAEHGNIPLDRTAIRYLRAHIKYHESMRGAERPSDVIQSSELKIRRVNPLDFTWDPTVDDRDDASWKHTRFLMRKDDIVDNQSYDKDAREQVQQATDRWESKPFMPSIQTQGSYDIPETMVMIHEVFDLVDQKRYLFADSCSLMLRVEDRGLLADVQPSGPFHELVFVEDPSESHGISPVSSFAGEQAAATHIAAANVSGAVESRPRLLIDKRHLDPAQASLIQDGKAGSIIMLTPMGNVDRKIGDSFFQAPTLEVPVQNIAIKADMIHGIERRSGLGVAKMGGGEQSPTATGAALGADASNAIGEDRGALIDAWSTNVARSITRLTRRFVPHAQIVSVCGEIAIEAWPEQWATGDIKNDIGVDIVPGSSRRKNTNVDQKQILDGIAALSQVPFLQALPSAQKLTVQLFEMFFEDAGSGSLDWKSVEQELQAQADMQAAMMEAQQAQMGLGGPGDAQGESGGPEGPGGQPGAPQAPGGPPSGPASSPATEGATQPNDLAQGVANTGGGRVATGASVGDKIRLLRGGAQERNKNRG